MDPNEELGQVDNRDRQARTRLLFGSEGLTKLSRARVMIAGLGGVGGAVCEALARVGVGSLTLIDCDRFSPSNLNRQILSTEENLGCLKTQAAEQRLARINSTIRVRTLPVRICPDNIADLIKTYESDLIIDCIDDLKAKAALIESALKQGKQVLVAGGAGNKIQPDGLKIAYLEDAFNDPLLKVLRRRLGAYPRQKILTVFSPSQPLTRSGPVASSPYLPNLIGFTLAGLAIELLVELR